MLQRALNAMCLDKWSLVHFINPVLQRVGLRLVNGQYYDELLRLRYEHYFLQHRIEQLEEEQEECQSERDALKVKVALLNLQDVAGTIGYEVHWLKEGEGEQFTLIGGDEPLTFPQTLDEIEYALEIVLHDAAVVAKSEV